MPTTEAVPTANRAHGPSALGGSLRRFIELTLTLARTDFKLRYFGSALGYFWQLARPLLFFGVIYVFFTQIINVGGSTPHYGVYLLTGIVLWTFFAEATGNAVSSLVNREALLRKVRFPRLAVPLGVTLTSVFNLAMNSIAVIVLALINGITPKLSWLWMLPIMLGFIVLALGVAMLLSALYVRYRDVQPIWDVTLQMLFYATPIMYPASKYAGLEHLALLNPFGMLITQMGHSFVYAGTTVVTSTVPQAGLIATHVAGKLVTHSGTILRNVKTVEIPLRSAYAAGGGLVHVLISISTIPIVLLFGLWYFNHEAPHFAENL
jgi:ABC-2 type transport system permease protein